MDTTGHTPPATQSDAPSSTPTTLEPVVQTLILKYGNIEVLHPLLQKIFKSPAQKELFASITQHDYNRLMTRSQKLEDHQVNAYEKAFCMLMENEDDRIGGLEIYVEKILGIGDLEECASDEEKEKWMLKGVAVRALLERGWETNNLATTNPVSSSVSVSQSQTSPATKPAQQQQTEHQQPPTSQPTTPSKPKPHAQPSSILTNKLLPLYHTAKTDFHALPALTPTSTPQHVAEKTKAAKFLRDTVENCIQYLTTTTTTGTLRHEGKEEGDEGLMMELQGTLKVAKDVAEVGSGGRKRRFDLVGGGQRGWGEKRGGWMRGGGRGGVRGGMRGGLV